MCAIGDFDQSVLHRAPGIFVMQKVQTCVQGHCRLPLLIRQPTGFGLMRPADPISLWSVTYVRPHCNKQRCPAVLSIPGCSWQWMQRSLRLCIPSGSIRTTWTSGAAASRCRPFVCIVAKRCFHRSDLPGGLCSEVGCLAVFRTPCQFTATVCESTDFP